MADLTKADKDALARLPHDWFSVTNVTYMVRRPWWRCERLFKLGVLERRDVGQVWQYRRATAGVQARCPTCNGDDAQAPCAYPGEGKPGCLRDARIGGVDSTRGGDLK